MIIEAPVSGTGIYVAILVSLIIITLWRVVVHRIQQSHARRLVFHAIILMSNVVQLPFWISQSSSKFAAAFSVGMSLLLLSPSLLFLCIVMIIFQWTHVLHAGLMTPEKAKARTKIMLLYPLLLLHLVEMCASLLLVSRLVFKDKRTPREMLPYLDTLDIFTVGRTISLVTGIIDVVMTCSIGLRLQIRLASCSMAPDFKRKTIVRISCAMAMIVFGVVFQFILEIPVIIYGFTEAWTSMHYLKYMKLAHFAPLLVLTTSFLYLMRRQESRKPAVIVRPRTPSIKQYDFPISPNCAYYNPPPSIPIAPDYADFDYITEQICSPEPCVMFAQQGHFSHSQHSCSSSSKASSLRTPSHTQTPSSINAFTDVDDLEVRIQ